MDKSDKLYLAININDYRDYFRRGETSEPKVSFQLIKAKNIKSAKEIVRKDHPGSTWGVVPVGQIEKHMVFERSTKA
ncbi:MAG TPA: hypothetical protein PK263_01980 [bacterium]|nr:hypothetical protein [bacterium]